MNKIIIKQSLFFVLYLFFCLFSVSCKEDGKIQQMINKISPQKESPTDEHNHDHENGHDHSSHEGHSHAEGESCGSDADHGHDHDNGHDHSSHEGHDHAEGESCGSDADHGHDHDNGHDHSSHEGHSHAEGETCGSEDDHGHDHAQDNSDGHDHGSTSNHNIIVFSKENMSKIEFAVEECTYDKVNMIIKTVAQLTPTQNAEQTIVAKTDGIVNFLDRTITVGTAVEANRTIFAIEGGGMLDNNIDVKYRQIMSAYEQTKKEYERKKKLAVDKIVSEKDLLSAKLAYENAQTAYAQMRITFTKGAQIIQSPIGGYINGLFVSNGDFVAEGTPILSVFNDKKLFVKAEVSPSYYEHLHSILNANIRKLNSSQTYSINDLNGRLVSYGRSIDATNPLLPVVFEIDNTIDMLSGEFVELYIECEAINNAEYMVSVPNAAIVEEMGNFFVFVQVCEEEFEKRNVVKGATDGKSTQIIFGLKEGEEIVTKGAIMVKLAQGSAALDPHAGHAH